MTMTNVGAGQFQNRDREANLHGNSSVGVPRHDQHIEKLCCKYSLMTSEIGNDGLPLTSYS